jgi:peptide/nickel transport system substrate-binding protein
MSPRPRLGRLVAAGMAAIIVIVGCGGPAPSTSPEASFLPGPSGDPFPSAPPSTGAFERMAYPAEGPAPCEEPASDDPSYGPYEGSLQRVFARDEHTVVFELCDSDPAFLAKIASPALAIDDTAWLQSRLDPADGGAPRILTEVNGTGPFRLDTWDGTSDITLSRSETYWGVHALTPSAIVTSEGDAGQRLAKLRDGSVDAVDEIAAADIEAVEANPELTLAPRQGLNIAYIGFDNRFAPFDNETVRQAIAIGIDRAAIVDAGFPPGTQVATHFLPCAIPYGCGGNAWPEMDAEAARDMLADVGFADGFTSTISFPQEPRDYLPDPNATALALQAQLQDQLGIQTTLKPMPFDELVAAADAGRLEGFYLLGARARYPDASLLLESHFGPGASLQFGNRFDDIRSWLLRGHTGDADAREKGYRGVNDLLRRHVPMIPLAHVGTAAAFRSDVSGKQASSTSTDRFVSVLPGDRTQFVYMQHGRPGSLFCADETDDVALRVCAQVSESLYRHDLPEPALAPSLATGCAPDENLTVWTCTLRDDVRFHDGAALDANDVVLSYAVRWDAANPLHRGRQGTFQAFVDRFGGFLHPPATP